MKLLHAISSLDPKGGGVSQALRTSIKGLARLGVNNEVVCINEPDADYLANEDFPIYAMGAGITSWQYNAKALAWLKQNIRNYDAIVVHGLWQFQTYAVYHAWKGSEQKKPRLFVMPHGMLDPYFQRAKGRKLKAWRNFAFWKLIENKIINHADGVFFTCKQEQALAREPFSPYIPKTEVVVGLGVDGPPPFAPLMGQAFAERCSELQGNSYFLFLGRIHEKKGADLLIQAYNNLCSDILGKRIRCSDNRLLSLEQLPKLVIAGPNGETPFGQKLQKTVSQHPVLKERIYFTGMLTGDAKWGAFYGCEAFILPSHQENFGIAVVEALACSKPVLISNQVNIYREIEEQGGGFIAPDTMEGTYALLVKWCISTIEQKQTLQKRARELYLKNYSVNQAAECFKKALS